MSIRAEEVVTLTRVDDGINGADAVQVYIHSSAGTAFKNDEVNTQLTVTIYYGALVITDQAGLEAAFGPGSYLQWQVRLHGEQTYHTVPASDSRLSNNGFTFDISPADVNVQAVFHVQVIIPD
jgi:hypothetical protein